MMSCIPFLGLVVLCGIFSQVSAVGTQFGQSTTGNGFVVISATYSDATCSRLDLADNVMYVPMGACIPTSTSSSVLYSTSDNINVIISQYTTTATCSGTALADVTVITTAQSITTAGTGGSTGTVVRQTCAAQAGTPTTSWVSSYYITGTAPVLAGSVKTTSYVSYFDSCLILFDFAIFSSFFHHFTIFFFLF